MATAEQIKSLIKSHLQDDSERFVTTALQLAAYEAHKGHTTLARDIRYLIDKQKSKQLKLVSFHKDLSDFIHSSKSQHRLSDIILKPELKGRVNKILKEYYQRQKLLRYGLSNRRKILLAGPPGTGKTMTASVIAGELKLPFFTIQMDKIVTKFMGETSAKLRQVFDTIQNSEGVFLFDEFDAIGSDRGRSDDVGEIRRVLNAFLQFIEKDQSKSIIVSATNNMKILDKALFRRFDDILYYELPSKKETLRLIENRLASFLVNLDVQTLIDSTEGLSHAEITQACYDSIKEAILEDKTMVSKELMINNLKNRKSVYNHK
ncbi:MAG: ATP-binding protein [Bdellovibrionales bacterium]|nr:ATP-binding protein [Bdellovibrionales bacterium]